MEALINTTAVGISTDSTPGILPEGRINYALNAVNESSSGDYGSYISERGTTALNTDFSLLDPGASFILLGSINLPDYEVVQFWVNTTETMSRISLQNKGNQYTTLVRSSNLGFKVSSQITGIGKIKNGCERIIYFRDSVNSPRFLNLDQLSSYLFPGQTQATANTSGTGWDTDLMKFFPHYNIPEITDFKINDTGGSIPVGSYQFVLGYYDKDFNQTEWFEHSPAVHITDEKLDNSEYDGIDGSPNTVPPTTKSIKLRFENLDTRYRFLKIAVIEYTSGTGIYSRVIELDPIEFSNASMEWTYIGPGSQPINITLEELNVPRIKYATFGDMEHIDQTLIISAPTERLLDFSKFQAVVNNIQVRWYAQKFNASSNDILTNELCAKSPKVTAEGKGFMSNETYALSARYTFKDGYRTPWFHIPGRAKDTNSLGNTITTGEANLYSVQYPHNRPAKQPSEGWDSAQHSGLLGTWLNDYSKEVQHIPGTLQAAVERWQVFNTAYVTEIPSTPLYDLIQGECSYWESTIDYPEDKDCNNNRLYPTGKIRHHKLPDTALIPHFTTDGSSGVTFVWPLGFSFTNIQFPAEYASEILGIEFGYSPRGEHTTVFDKALLSLAQKRRVTRSTGEYQYVGIQSGLTDFLPTALHHMLPSTADGADYYDWFNDYSGNSYYAGDQKVATLHSPQLAFSEKYPSATHVKFERVLHDQFYTTIYGTANKYGSFGTFFNSLLQDTTQTNRAITTQMFVSPNRVATGGNMPEGIDVFDNRMQQECFLVGLEDAIDHTMLTGAVTDDTDSNTGAQHTGKIHYVSIERYLPQQYGMLHNLKYAPISRNIHRQTDITSSSRIFAFGGDVFISKYHFRRSHSVKISSGSSAVLYCSLLGYWVQSSLNTEMRHEGTANYEVYFPKSYKEDPDTFLFQEAKLTYTFIPNYYAVNSDFLINRVNKLDSTLPLGYNYCNRCLNDYPFRLLATNQAFQEDRPDSYLNIPVNRYRDLPSSSGPITGLSLAQDKLFVHTQHSLFQLPVKEELLSITNQLVSLAAADLFQRSPIEFIPTPSGYVGASSPLTTTVSEFGLTFLNEETGRIFNIQSKLEEISNKDLHNWLKEHLPSQLNAYHFNLFGTDYPFQHNPSNPNGVGTVITYDPRHKRILITHKDYKPVQHTYINKSGVTITEYPVFNGTQWFVTENSTSVPTTFSNTNYFENKSWTLSYSFLSQSWISYHSYLPYIMYNNGKTFFSVVSGSNQVFEHNTGSYQTYYGSKYPFIIDLPILKSPLVPQVYAAAHLFCKAYLEVEDNMVLQELMTFDQALAYTEDQTTGLRDLLVTNSIPYSSNTIANNLLPITLAGSKWRVNSFFDLIVNKSIPLFSTSWTDTSYQAAYPIDKVVNSNAISLTKDSYSQSRLRGSFMNLRLFFKPVENAKMVMNVSATIAEQIVR